VRGCGPSFPLGAFQSRSRRESFRSANCAQYGFDRGQGERRTDGDHTSRRSRASLDARLVSGILARADQG